ncbi:MAG TPA: DMT family transporter [Acidimicrobiia bacterium]|nr:DMT family transporter [Acidimicrobiia bacterium]
MGVVLAAVAAFGYGTGDFLGGVATRRIPAASTLFWSHLVGLALLAVWIPLDPGEPIVSDMIAGAGAGLFGLAGLVFLYTGLARGRAAVVAPAAAVVGAIVPVIAGVAGGDPLGALGWAGVAAALPAIYLVSTIEGTPRRAAGLGYGLMAGLFFGGYFTVLAQASDASGMWPLVASRGLSVTVLVVAGLAARRSWLTAPGGRVGGAVVGVGVLDLIGNVAYLLAANLASLVVVAMVASLYPAVTVLMTRLVYSERLSPHQLSGLGLAVLAVACFSAV